MGACLSQPSSEVGSYHAVEVSEGSKTYTSNNKSQYSMVSSTTDGNASATSIGSNTIPSSTGSENSEDLAYPRGRILPHSNLKVFTLAELKKATNGFRKDNLLGEGGFGKVYKGWMNEKVLGPAKKGHGKVVAVKKLNSQSVQGWREWQSEVIFLGRLSHPNLVKLLGYGSEKDELLLVYEFMSKGSLENHLFRRGAVSHVLTWNQRLKIAIDAARGLAFLHTSERKIIYRDFKASNILLDMNYNAKLSDFGLAKEGPEAGETHVSTRVMGTYGYVAPEYATTGHLYVKSDVYAFGVVLLELLTGKRALDMYRPTEQLNLVAWMKPFLTDRKKFARIMDPQLAHQYPQKVAFSVCQLTNRCISFEPVNRPSMTDVVETLESIVAAEDNDDARELKVMPPRPGARNFSMTPPRNRPPYHSKSGSNEFTSPAHPSAYPISQ